MKDLHTEALCWLRYGKRMPIVCTEAGRWNADVLGVSDTTAVEVEVKKSRADLLADFRNKIAKHEAYSEGRSATVPNYLYYFVPQELAFQAREILDEKCPKAGLLVLTDTNYWDGRNAYVAKRPAKLRAEPPSRAFVIEAMMRMSSQICGMSIALRKLKALQGQPPEPLEEDLALASIRASSILDIEDEAADLHVRGRELALAVECLDLDSASLEVQTRWREAARQLLAFQHIQAKAWLEDRRAFRKKP